LTKSEIGLKACDKAVEALTVENLGLKSVVKAQEDTLNASLKELNTLKKPPTVFETPLFWANVGVILGVFLTLQIRK
jgi:hypothetical protein